jgi:hypothetical protein
MKKSRIILVAILLVSIVGCSVLVYFGFFHIGRDPLRGVVARNISDYNAIGIAMRRQISNLSSNSTSMAFTNSQGGNSQGGNNQDGNSQGDRKNVFVGRDEDDEDEEIVFENEKGNVVELPNIAHAVFFDKFTFFQTADAVEWNTFNRLGNLYPNSNGFIYVMDNDTGKIHSISARDFHINDAGFFGQNFNIGFTVSKIGMTHSFNEWFESNTAVYGKTGDNFYRYKIVNEQLEIKRITNNNSAVAFRVSYVDIYDNLFGEIWDTRDQSGGFVGTVHNGVLNETSGGAFTARSLCGDINGLVLENVGRKSNKSGSFRSHTCTAFGGRAENGKVFLADRRSYFDESGVIKTQDEAVDLTFLVRRSLGERDGFSFSISVYEPLHGINRYVVRNETTGQITVEVQTRDHPTLPHYAMPAIMDDKICIIEGKTIAAYCIVTGERTILADFSDYTSIYEISWGFTNALGFIVTDSNWKEVSGYILPCGEIIPNLDENPFVVLSMRFR